MSDDLSRPWQLKGYYIVFLFLSGDSQLDEKERRMQTIITRRKLVDLAKTQSSDIGVLRAEVERLRMRTFPALVQVENS